MEKLKALTKRNLLEIIRDPLAVIFCIIFPVVMLVFIQVLFINLEFVPAQFEIENYAFGICVFGYTFVTLFISMRIAGDNNSSFIKRINILPVSKFTYLFSFFLSALPITLIQTVLFILISTIFGLSYDLNLLLSVVYLIPSMMFYISIGVLIGFLCSKEEYTGPICSILISLTGILGGVFMPIEAFGGVMKVVVNVLPFSHSVTVASGIYTIGARAIYPHVLITFGYTVLTWIVIYTIAKFKE